MHRRALISAVLAGVLALSHPAAADTGGSAITDSNGVHSEANRNDTRTGSPASSGRTRCTYRVVAPGDALPSDQGAVTLPADDPGRWYEKWCGTDYFGVVFITPRNPTELIEEARRYLLLPLPVPQLNPAGDQIVNLPTWMWLDGGWTSQTSSVSVPGITVTVTADPLSAMWTMGDGSAVVCDGPGTPFDPTRPSAMQSSSCSHTYARSSAGQPASTFPVSVTLRWRARWDVIGTTAGSDLGTIDRTTSFTLRVGEVQAVNTRN
jgi:hypothetical protein